MKRMKARYPGECVECGGVIVAGDTIAYGGRHNVRHAECAREEGGGGDAWDDEPPRIRLTHDSASGLYLASINRYDDGARDVLKRRGLGFHFGDCRCRKGCLACAATIPENVYYTNDANSLRGLEGYMDAEAKTAMKAHFNQGRLPLRPGKTEPTEHSSKTEQVPVGHVCSYCGLNLDQDYNAAKNMLRMWRERKNDPENADSDRDSSKEVDERETGA